MLVKNKDLIFIFPVPVLLFGIGYLENIEFFSAPLLLDLFILPILFFFIIFIYKKSPAFLCSSAMIIYYYIGMIVSLLVISTGVHVIEIDKYGKANGSTLILLSIFIYTVMVSKISFEWANSWGVFKIKIIPLKIINIALLLFILITLVLGVYIFIIYDGPVLQGIHRVVFWKNMEVTGLAFYPTLVLQTFYFVAYYYLYTRCDVGRSYLSSLLLFGYIFVTIFVLGEKFSAFVIYVVALLSLLPSFISSIKLSPKNIAIASMAFILIVTFISWTYISEGREIGFILTRVALQGQLIWSVFNDSFPQIIGSQTECFMKCDDFINGRDYISYKYLPTKVYNYYMDTGTSLSGFFPALQLVTFGLLPSLFLHTIHAILTGVLQAKMIKYNKNRNFIIGFLLFKVNLSAYLWWYAGLSSVLNGLLVSYFVIAVYIFLSKSLSQKELSDN